MSRKLRFTKKASADIRSAFRGYETQRPKLGEEFVSALERLLAIVREYPEIGPVVHRDVRRVFLSRFPYVVYYRVADGIEVRACLHQRRDREGGKG